MASSSRRFRRRWPPARGWRRPEKILEVLSGGLAANKVMEVKREKFLSHDFEPGGKVEFHRKDLRIALEAGRSTGCRCRSRRWCTRCSRP